MRMLSRGKQFGTGIGARHANCDSDAERKLAAGANAFVRADTSVAGLQRLGRKVPIRYGHRSLTRHFICFMMAMFHVGNDGAWQTLPSMDFNRSRGTE